MIVQFQFRFGTGAQWAAENPILAVGEPGYDTTNGGQKIGNGVDHWADLEYQSTDPAELDAILTAVQQAAADAEAAAAAAEAAAAGATGATDSGVAALVNDTTPPNATRQALNALYAVIAHTHTASQITDLNTAIYDALVNLLDAGANVTLTPTGGGITIAATGGGGSSGLDAEAVIDYLGGITTPAEGIKGSGLVSVAVNDAANTITISTTATANSSDAFLLNRVNHTGEAASWQNSFADVANTAPSEGWTIRRRGTLWTPEAFPDLSRFPTKDGAGGGLNGSIRQFADVDDGAIVAGAALVGTDAGTYAPTDLDALYVAKDPTSGRMLESSLPLHHPPLQVLDPGELPDPTVTLPSIIYRRQAAPSLVPVLLVANLIRNASALALTVPEDLLVGQGYGLAIAASNEATGPLDHFDLSYSTGAATPAWNGWSTSGATSAIVQAIIRPTTLVPSAGTLTITARTAAGTALSRPHILAALFRLPNLAPAPAHDQVAIGSGNSVSSMTAVRATATGQTAQSDEVEIGVASWNSLAAPGDRTLAGTNGWNELSQQKSDSGTGARSLFVGYKIVTAVETPSFTTLMTASDGQTGQWAADLVTYKAG